MKLIPTLCVLLSLSLTACGGQGSGKSSPSSIITSKSSSHSSQTTTSSIQVSSSSSAASISEQGTVPDILALSKQVIISWQSPVQNLNYQLYYAETPNCDWNAYTLCPGGTLVQNVSSPYTLNNLKNGQNYWFKLISNGRVNFAQVGARPDYLAFNDSVLSQTQDDLGTHYYGGRFTQVGAFTGPGVIVNNQTLKPTAFPLVEGNIYTVISAPQGGWYIGGKFNKVGGLVRHHLAHISAAGAVTDWQPAANNPVTQLTLWGQDIVALGEFTEMNGVAHKQIALLNAKGDVSDWNPAFKDDYFRLNTAVVIKDSLLVGGSFKSTDNLNYIGLTLIDKKAQRTDWLIQDNNYQSVNQIILTKDKIYVMGSFSNINRTYEILTLDYSGHSLNQFGLEDARPVQAMLLGNTLFLVGVQNDRAQRRNLYLMNTQTQKITQHRSGMVNIKLLMADEKGVAMNITEMRDLSTQATTTESVWMDETGFTNASPFTNPNITQIALNQNAYYVAGSFNQYNGLKRSRLAAINAQQKLTAWAPDVNGPVYSLAQLADTVYVGGDFTMLNGVKLGYLASINKDGSRAYWQPHADNRVLQLIIKNEHVFILGNFLNLNDESRKQFGVINLAADLEAYDLKLTGNEFTQEMAVSDNQLCLKAYLRDASLNVSLKIICMDAKTPKEYKIVSDFNTDTMTGFGQNLLMFHGDVFLLNPNASPMPPKIVLSNTPSNAAGFKSSFTFLASTSQYAYVLESSPYGSDGTTYYVHQLDAEGRIKTLNFEKSLPTAYTIYTAFITNNQLHLWGDGFNESIALPNSP